MSLAEICNPVELSMGTCSNYNCVISLKFFLLTGSLEVKDDTLKKK